LEFRLLGAVEVRDGGEPLELGPPKQRAVLAALLVDAGRPVRTETIVDRVWDDDPPAEARNALYAHIMRIRRMLARAADQPDAGPRLARVTGGYQLDVDLDLVDWHRFRRLVEAARDPAAGDEQRAELLREALGLWGDPLADLAGSWVSRVREGARQLRLDAVVAWAQVELRLGNHEPVIARVRELAADHPLVEPLAAVQMRALYAAGRAAEALDWYAAVRNRLAEELGADPGPELQELHRGILRGEGAPSPGVPADATTPAQLPADVAGFAGREQELAQLDDAIAAEVAVVAISGTAGVGKTTLAVHWAHRVHERFPDGQLYANLRGFEPGGEAMAPAEALRGFLEALSTPHSRIPSDLDAQAGLFRSLLAGRRMLIVLDNARETDQVRPLLPGAPGHLVVVTSRNQLADLDAAYTMSLEMLPPEDSVTLFVQTAGEDRLANEPRELVSKTIELCGRLPLAIRIAAARLRFRPSWRLADLVERLRDQDQRLAELADGSRGVAAALDLSYQQLTTDQQRMYRLVGLHPGQDIDPYAAAALTRTAAIPARRLLDQLLDAHLLQETRPSRYVLHDLVRAHAADTAGATETAPDRRAALTRLLDHYRHTAARAMDVAYPYDSGRRPRVPPAGFATPGDDPADPGRAVALLDVELPNVLAAARYAANHGWPEHTMHLSAILHRHLYIRGRLRDAESIHQQALAIARDTGNRAGELAALIDLGETYRLQGHYQQALDQYGLALAVARDTGNRASELDALTGLGHVHHLQGRYQQALDSYRLALAVARDTGNRTSELNALRGLGYVYQLQGSYQQALDHMRPALEMARATGNQASELNALRSLGQVYQLQGRYQQALDHYRRALAMARIAGSRIGELAALVSLGCIHRLEGRYQPATDHYRLVLSIAHEIDNRNWEFEALHGLGRIHHATGHPQAALAHHRQALQLATDLGQPTDQARAHNGLAHAFHAMNDHEHAGQHWQQALDILTGLGTDYTEDEETTTAAVRAHLAGLNRVTTAGSGS
jgi:DNA-binding SARP family transcriptional activator/Tfp pilus assembly protein PilF